MGLFDKGKKKESFSELMQNNEEAIAPDALTADAPLVKNSESRSKAPSKPARPQAYGINDAISLMRTLPQDNLELVIRVVKSTLQSADIQLGAIIKDATSKEERMNSLIESLHSEIAALGLEIEERRSQIEAFEDDLSETSKVKESLILAESIETSTHSHTPGIAESSSWEQGSTRTEGTLEDCVPSELLEPDAEESPGDAEGDAGPPRPAGKAFKKNH